MYLKRLITAAFGVVSGFIMLGLDGHVCAIPIHRESTDSLICGWKPQNTLDKHA